MTMRDERVEEEHLGGDSRRAMTGIQAAPGAGSLSLERHLRNALAAGGMTAWEWDLTTGAIRYLSNAEAIARTRDISPYATIDGMVGMVHPDDRPAFQAAVRRTVETGADFVYEARVLMADGTYRWILGRGSVATHEGGRPALACGISKDVSERKEAEERLAQANADIRTIMESSTDAIFMKDADGRCRFINTAGARFFGKTPEEIVGRDHIELLGEREGRDLQEREAAIMAAGRAQVAEEELSFGGGVRRIFSAQKTPVRDAQGRVVGIIGVARDITEQKRNEREILESQSLVRSIMDSTGDMIWTVDRGHHGLIMWNRAVADYFRAHRGLPLAAGMRPEDLFPVGSNHAREWHGLYAQAEAQGSLVIEKTLSDDAHVLLLSINPVRRDDRTLALAVFGKDISALRRAEAGLRISEDRLRQSEKMAAIGQLAGGMAHDYNNQLAAVNAFAELIRDQAPPDGAIRGFAQDILAVVGNTAGLTRNLLAFARKGRYRLGRVDLHQVVAGTVGILAHSLEKRITLRADLVAGEAVVLGDETQLANALLNLALNARDAIAGNGEIVFASAFLDLSAGDAARRGLSLAPGRFIELSVRDTGHGMDEATRRRLFEPFFTTKPKGKGTGMGLAAVWGIVTNHQGTVTVESSPGAGATFRLYLPLVAAAAGEGGAPAARNAQRGLGRILIVDDEPALLRSLSFVVEGLGYTVTAEHDGARAVETYRASWREIDLVLLDLSMPGMSGKEVFLAMRAINPGVRTLLMSGYGLDAEIQEALELGVRGFLEKPFSREEASRWIAEIVGSAPPA